MANLRILVLGGYGVFGGRLARRLAQRTEIEVLVAGRDFAKAKAFCEKFGGTPVAIDRDGDCGGAFRRLEPAIVIDAAGPFQAYGADPYRVAKAAIDCRAHYLDLADDSAFVQGICAMDESARTAGVAAISGASSIPAISSAALDHLTRGLSSVSLVGSAILPGNRAPRGLSVVRAIVGQAGRPLRVWRGGAWTWQPAWGRLIRFDLTIDRTASLGSRFGSLIGAPDLALFPDRYKARSVLFHAGLELSIMHLGLWLMALPVRFGLLRSLEPMAGSFKWVADRLERFGMDQGGMLVYAIGRDEGGNAVERRWTLIAQAGDGPEVPPTPAYVMALRLAQNSAPCVGASAAVGQLSLAEIENGFSGFGIRTATAEVPARPLLERVLPEEFDRLPAAWRRLAEIHDVDAFQGMASVTRGNTVLARMIAAVFGFPKSTTSIAVNVEKLRTPGGERWTRRFGGKPFVSHLSRRPDDRAGILRERFGPFSFALHLRAQNGQVFWPVGSWRFLGIPMPRVLMPRSETTEFVGDDGKFHFDVGIAAPLIGLIVRYQGWLEPVN